MADTNIPQTLPTIPVFKLMKDCDRRQAYMKAFKALQEGRAPYPEKRLKLLKVYAQVAGWDPESISTMESAAQTPVHQK